MAKFIWRSFIIMVIFLAGLLIGNIFTPKQILEEKDITAVPEPKTYLDLTIEDNYETLRQSYNINEVYIAFLRQTYKKDKKEYEYQLENLNKNDNSRKDFIKAQKSYLAVIGYITQNYPVKQEEPVSLEQPSAEEQIQEQTAEPAQQAEQTEITQDLTKPATQTEQI